MELLWAFLPSLAILLVIIDRRRFAAEIEETRKRIAQEQEQMQAEAQAFVDSLIERGKQLERKRIASLLQEPQK